MEVLLRHVPRFAHVSSHLLHSPDGMHVLRHTVSAPHYSLGYTSAGSSKTVATPGNWYRTPKATDLIGNGSALGAMTMEVLA